VTAPVVIRMTAPLALVFWPAVEFDRWTTIVRLVSAKTAKKGGINRAHGFWASQCGCFSHPILLFAVFKSASIASSREEKSSGRERLYILCASRSSATSSHQLPDAFSCLFPSLIQTEAPLRLFQTSLCGNTVWQHAIMSPIAPDQDLRDAILP